MPSFIPTINVLCSVSENSPICKWAIFGKHHILEHISLICMTKVSRCECALPLCPPQVVLVFPGPGAVSVRDMMQCLQDQGDRKSRCTSYEPRVKRLKSEDVRGTTHTTEQPESGTPDESRVQPLQRVVFIDSTWNQTNKISTDERLQGTHEWSRSCNLFTLTARDTWGIIDVTQKCSLT